QEYQVAVGGLPGTYLVRTLADRTEVRWHYAAADEQRTFVLRYLVRDAVAVHNDAAELYWQFIGDDWDIPADHVRVELTLPAGAGDVRAWGHGPLHGQVDIDDEASRVTWDVVELPPFTMVEGRVVFDPVAVAGGCTTGKTALPDILAGEGRWAAEANSPRWIIRVDLLAAMVALPLGVAALTRYMRRFGMDPRPDWSGEDYRELPGDYGPAELTRLLSRERSYQLGPAIAATLLDLGRRGHVHLQPVATTGWLGLQREDLALSRAQPPEDDSLQPHERLLLNFLLDKVAGGEPELRLSTLNRWFQRNQGDTREF